MEVKTFISGPLSVNCYLVIDEETKVAVIVDPGGENRKLVQHIAENQISIKAILLTHGHPDHLCGLDFIRKEYPEATVIAHEDEANMLAKPEINHSKQYCGKEISITADRYVKDLDHLSVGNLEFIFIHTPGHTPGGMCIYVGNSLFSGDTLFKNSIGRTDFPYASYTTIKKSIQSQLFVLPDETIVYPGHEDVTSIGYEKENNPFV